MTKSKIIIFVVAVFIVVTTLFISPFFGKADDGSFYDILTANGIYNLENNDANYFNGVYGISPSSESEFVPITVAKVMSGYSDTKLLDIRVLAAIYLPFYLCGMFLIIRRIKVKNNILEIVISALATVIMIDIGYISYLNSFYYEALYLSAFLLFVGSLLNIKNGNAVFVPCAVTFIISAAVLATMGVAGLLAGVIASIVLILGATVFKNISRYALVCGILAILISVGSFYAAPHKKQSVSQLYSRVFSGALQDSKNAEGDLAELGIDKEFSAYAGKSYFEAVGNEGVLPPVFVKQLEKVSTTDILLFYTKHPARFLKVLTMAGKDTPFLSQSYINTKMNVEYSLKSAPGVWSYARNITIPGNVWILFALTVGAIVFAFLFYKKDIEILATGISTSVAAMVFLINSILGGGLYLLSRKAILHQAAIDLLVVLIVVCAANIIITKRQELKDKYGVNQ